MLLFAIMAFALLAFAIISNSNKANANTDAESKVFYNKGNIANTKDNYQESISDYTEAIRLDPKNVMAYNRRGLSYYRLEDYIKATKDATKACSLGDCALLEIIG